MFSLEIDCDPDDRDLLIAELWEQGSAGIVELNPVTVRAFFEDGANRAALLATLSRRRGVREEEQRDWVQSARDLLQPMEVGARFFLVPEWRDDPAPAGRFRIVVNPGMAFGTGVHETTRLCIEALEDFLRPGMTVLDVGTGSGILARAAALLGRGQGVGLRYRPGGGGDCRGWASSARWTRWLRRRRTWCWRTSARRRSSQLAPDLLRVREGRAACCWPAALNSMRWNRFGLRLPGVREVRQKGNWALPWCRAKVFSGLRR